jgi:Mn-dependent DtxR family transcriptional regulator
MSKIESKLPIDPATLAEFLAGLEKVGLIKVNREKLKALH